MGYRIQKVFGIIIHRIFFLPDTLNPIPEPRSRAYADARSEHQTHPAHPPPVAKACEPPGGIARLAGCLKEQGVGCTVLDADLEGQMRLLAETAEPADRKFDTWTARACRGCRGISRRSSTAARQPAEVPTLRPAAHPSPARVGVIHEQASRSRWPITRTPGSRPCGRRTSSGPPGNTGPTPSCPGLPAGSNRSSRRAPPTPSASP